jgi:hypothetical protein
MQLEFEVADERNREALREILQAAANLLTENWPALRPAEVAPTTVHFVTVLGPDNKHLISRITSIRRKFQDGRTEKTTLPKVTAPGTKKRKL